MSDMTYDNGTFFKYATDVVFYQPLIELSCYRILTLEDEVQYIYTANTGLNEGQKAQNEVSDMVWAKKKSACVEDFKKRMESSNPEVIRAYKSSLEENPDLPN